MLTAQAAAVRSPLPSLTVPTATKSPPERGEGTGDGGPPHTVMAAAPLSRAAPPGRDQAVTDGLRVELGYTGMKRRRRNPKRNVRMGGCSRSFLCVGWRRANGANPASSQSSSAIKFGENI